jgi:nitronate monooxygenase
MWPNRSLIELFEIEHPLVLAPMAGLGTVGLAASVCEAGGLGSIGCATMQPQLVAKTIQELRGLTSKPINVNFFCHAQAKLNPDREHAWQDRLLPYYHELGIDYEPPRSRLDITPFGDAVCAVIEEAKPEVVSFHFGLPPPALLARVKAAGCRVMSSATTVEEALWLEAGGVDAIIAQGYEAGGHRGMFLAANLSSAIVSQPGSLPLVPQIVDAVSMPVVAAWRDCRRARDCRRIRAWSGRDTARDCLPPLSRSSNDAALSRCPAALARRRYLDDKRVQRTTRAHPG